MENGTRRKPLHPDVFTFQVVKCETSKTVRELIRDNVSEFRILISSLKRQDEETAINNA